jgi:hypothetical protein
MILLTGLVSNTDTENVQKHKMSRAGRKVSVIASGRNISFVGPPSLLPNDYRGTLCLCVKHPQRECDHSRPSTAEVNTWGFSSTLSVHVYTEMVLKHKGKFTFTCNYN